MLMFFGKNYKEVYIRSICMYRVGEEVTIREGLKPNTFVHGVFINNTMRQYFGNTYKITNVFVDYKGRVSYQLNNIEWSWVEEMFYPNIL